MCAIKVCIHKEGRKEGGNDPMACSLCVRSWSRVEFQREWGASEKGGQIRVRIMLILSSLIGFIAQDFHEMISYAMKTCESQKDKFWSVDLPKPSLAYPPFRVSDCYLSVTFRRLTGSHREVMGK